MRPRLRERSRSFAPSRSLRMRLHSSSKLLPYTAIELEPWQRSMPPELVRHVRNATVLTINADGDYKVEQHGPRGECPHCHDGPGIHEEVCWEKQQGATLRGRLVVSDALVATRRDDP